MMNAEPPKHDTSDPEVIAQIEEANRHAAKIFAENPSSILDEMSVEDLKDGDGFAFLGQEGGDIDDGSDELIEAHFAGLKKDQS